MLSARPVADAAAVLFEKRAKILKKVAFVSRTMMLDEGRQLEKTRADVKRIQSTLCIHVILLCIYLCKCSPLDLSLIHI